MDEISRGYCLDKNIHSGWHDYVPVYESLFEPIRDRPLTVVEIGIGVREKGQMGHCPAGYQTGNSLRCWRDYFPNARIHGIDLFEANMAESSDPKSRIRTYVGDQGNKMALTHISRVIRIRDGRKPIDIIIDDGSHLLHHQITTFCAIARFLSLGGLYIIEDVSIPYQPQYKDLTAFPETIRDWVRQNFTISYHDRRVGRHGKVPDDDFMVVFKRHNITPPPQS